MRAFIAVNIPQNVKDEIYDIIESIDLKNIPIRWTKKENMHLTLNFLGEIRKNKTDEIASIISQAVGGERMFDIELKGLSAFPNEKTPKILWLKITNGEDELNRLSEKIENKLIENGICKENEDKKAHLTIARIKDHYRSIDISDVVLKFQNINYDHVKVECISIMSSELKPEGPEYRILKKIPLA